MSKCLMRPFYALFMIILVHSAVPHNLFSAENNNSSLLFYLSGENGTDADFAANSDIMPNFIHGISVIPDGASGKGLKCDHGQLLSYNAPGNIYAERGTLSFFWRSRDPLGKIPFPVFRVSYSDHSSWDLVWLRIDYNGCGFDAFVTDINLARVRVSHKFDTIPAPDKWTHIAFSWDENKGVRLYVNGKLAASKDSVAVFYAGLDQFGPHSRIISPYQVQSLYNYERGGDIDELKIYDSMLGPDEVASLASGNSVKPAAVPFRNLSDSETQKEWYLRYGWEKEADAPPYLSAPSTAVKKVEIQDVYDVKQWMWKATDGIRETTWPYVFNRSRLAGRKDYFILPDWNCYSISGKSVTFFMPEEPFNHIEIAGGAYGGAVYSNFNKVKDSENTTFLFSRPSGKERTVNRLENTLTGGKVTFTNDFQEMPIGEFYAYNVTYGKEPEGMAKLSYTLTGLAEADNPCLKYLVNFIDGRFMPDERALMTALPQGAPKTPKAKDSRSYMPLVHVVVPFEFRTVNPAIDYSRFSYTWENMNCGLDGIAIDIPPLSVKPTHNGLFPMNIQVKDPIWPDRNLLDFSFSVKPGEARALWLDTRDRVLPNGYSLYLTITGAGQDFGADDLEGAKVRLVFKNRSEAAKEQEIDRFNQVKDNYGNMVEEYPNLKKLRMYDRYSRDMTDLFSVNPDHFQGRMYWGNSNTEQPLPAFVQPKAPRSVPLWAFRQIEDLKLLKKFCLWWIDNRQIANGELGGGLSDDGDFSNIWPGAALMGIEPEKLKSSTDRMMQAFYDQGMFTNGLATITADELHSYEEGISVIPQTMLLGYGDPKTVERLMETASTYDRITGVNKAGHRHFRSTYYSGTNMADEGIWEWSKPYNYLILHPGMVLVEFNGSPELKKLMLDVADGLLAHAKKDKDGRIILNTGIHFKTDEERDAGLGTAIHLLWAAWRWTGDKKYITPIQDSLDKGDNTPVWSLNADLLDLLNGSATWGRKIASSVTPDNGNELYRHIAWQITGDKSYLEGYYADQIQAGTQRMYMMTEGHWWSDRVQVANAELQRSRLGGVALTRNTIYPGHAISWKFEKPSSDESAAILVKKALPGELKIIVYNLEKIPVNAVMTGWDIDPGTWELVQGTDTDGDDEIDDTAVKSAVQFERTGSLNFVFKPGAATILNLKLKKADKNYWSRPDLGIGAGDIKTEKGVVTVRVHSLGSVDTPLTDVAIVDDGGNVIAKAQVPVLKAPNDLKPKTADVRIELPAGKDASGLNAVIDPGNKLKEITKLNNSVKVK